MSRMLRAVAVVATLTLTVTGVLLAQDGDGDGCDISTGNCPGAFSLRFQLPKVALRDTDFGARTKKILAATKPFVLVDPKDGTAILIVPLGKDPTAPKKEKK